MESRNNGQGIFYGVIGVATLVVTIIGATFAFFSASTNSDVNAVTVDSTQLTLGFSEVDTGLKHQLIPVDATSANFVTYPDVAATGCKDVNNNDICSVYQFTVSNPSETTAQRIYATFTPKTNTFENLHYAVFKGTSAQIKAKTAKFDVDGTAVTTVSDTTKNIIGTDGDLVISDTKLTNGSTSPITLAPLEQVLDPKGNVTYTIVLWIQELKTDQTSADAGKSFAGQVSFTTAAGTTGVTGVMVAAG